MPKIFVEPRVRTNLWYIESFVHPHAPASLSNCIIDISRRERQVVIMLLNKVGVTKLRPPRCSIMVVLPIILRLMRKSMSLGKIWVVNLHIRHWQSPCQGSIVLMSSDLYYTFTHSSNPVRSGAVSPVALIWAAFNRKSIKEASLFEWNKREA